MLMWLGAVEINAILNVPNTMPTLIWSKLIYFYLFCQTYAQHTPGFGMMGASGVGDIAVPRGRGRGGRGRGRGRGFNNGGGYGQGGKKTNTKKRTCTPANAQYLAARRL